METTRVRIRKDYQPLTIAVSVVNRTPLVPYAQTFKASEETYEPLRSKDNYTRIMPVVNAYADDGSLTQQMSNTGLSNMQWLVNDEKIEDVWGEDDYTVQTEGDVRGALDVYKNLSVGECVSVKFTATLADTRLGTLIPIETDYVLLSCVDSAEDDYRLALEEETSLIYDPFRDGLLLLDYLNAHGITPTAAQEEAATYVDDIYLRKIPFRLFRGTAEQSGYDVKLFYEGDEENAIDPDAEDNEIYSLAEGALVLDLRLIDSATYILKAYVEELEVAKIQFSVSRRAPALNVSASNGTSILPTDTKRIDKALVSVSGEVQAYPELNLKIIWKTTTKSKTVSHNEGARTKFKLKDTGIGDTEADDWLDVYMDVEQKGACEIALDDDDNLLCDDDENVLIIS